VEESNIYFAPNFYTIYADFFDLTTQIT